MLYHRRFQHFLPFLRLFLIAVLAVSTQAFSSLPVSNLSTRRSSINYKTSLNENNDSILDRFTSPKIDDPWLPLNEAGVAQVVAPTLQLFWLVAAGSPYPSWASPLYDPTFAARGAILAPTLVHGAGLASCWLVGCVAAKAFEKEAYEGSYGQVFVSTLKAGAFACGILVLGTQFQLYQDIGFAQPGDSPETDVRIYRALVEVFNDISFEGVTMLSYRMIRCAITK
jgi:hypothetical protein